MKSKLKVSSLLVKSGCTAIIIIILCCSCNDIANEDLLPAAKSTVEKNIEFTLAPDSSGVLKPLLLDIYLPPKKYSYQKFPLVVVFHEGGYQQGNKSSLEEAGRIFADSGFITASVDYRLGWRQTGGCEGTINTLAEAEYRGIQDANSALRFLIKHAEKYGINTDLIFIGGVSAGAAIALNSSYATDTILKQKSPDLYAKLGGLNNLGGNYTNSNIIKGIYSLSGSISDSNFIQKGKIIPTICFHGTDDDLVPFNTGYFLGCYKVLAFGPKYIYNRLILMNGICVLHQKQEGKHLPAEYQHSNITPLITEFFKQVMEGKAKSAIIIE